MKFTIGPVAQTDFKIHTDDGREITDEFRVLGLRLHLTPGSRTVVELDVYAECVEVFTKHVEVRVITEHGSPMESIAATSAAEAKEPC